MKLQKRAAFITLGCKVNQYDTQVIKENFQKNGFITVNQDSEFDVCVINTCTVTNAADVESKQIINRIKRKNPDARILVAGCFAKSGKDEIDKLEVDNFYDSEYCKSASTRDDIISRFDDKTRVFVKVQDGCNFYCSYCKVPYVRGRSKSKAFEDVKKEIKGLIKNEYKEVVLTGVNLGSYGIDLIPSANLCSLIKDIVNIEGDWRLRFSSVDPSYITEEIISLIAKDKKICRHLHIPLQSGDDYILKLMNRKYTVDYYAQLVSKIRSIMPDIAITTDIIVGFPGEKECNFNNTCKVAEKIGFSRTHIFTYSPRESTKAASFINKVSKHDIKKRYNVLNEIAMSKRIDYMKRFIGMEMEILVESDMDNSSKSGWGYADNYIKVRIDGYNGSGNEFVKVRLNSIDPGKGVGYGVPVL